MDTIEVQKKSKSFNISSFFGGIIFTLILAASGAAYYFFYIYKPEHPKKEDPTAMVEKPAQAVTATPTEIKIEIKDQTDANASKPNEEIKAPAEPSKQGTIKGKLCYPSSSLPSGEIAVKDTDSKQIKYFKVDGKTSTYEVTVDKGSYVLRYQAHASNTKPDEYLSGYYSKCAIDNSYENCSKAGAHDPITINVKNTDPVTGVDLCDFYYIDEPKF